MTALLADRLSAARRWGFVGRRAELAMMRSMLGAAPGVLYVHGPGGVGKTTLLRQFARLARAAGRRVVWLDARDAGPAAQRAAAALSAALEDAALEDAALEDAALEDAAVEDAALEDAALDVSDPGGAGVAGVGLAELRNCLLVVDTAEALGPLDRWLREDVLPRLPGDAIVAIAGRDPPSVPWRADPGWRHLLRTVRLDNLSPDESAELLRRRGVPRAARTAAVAATRGHPLGLALMADVCAQSGAAPTSADHREVLTALAAAFVEGVPDARHRDALEACAQVRVTTEPILAALLGLPDAHDLFAWLRGLSVVESGPHGIFPHDLVRDALAAELLWRHPERHAQIRARARAHYRSRFTADDPGTRQEVLVDYAYLHRQAPGLASMLATVPPGGADPGAGLVLDRPAPSELPVLRDMVERHEGPESARLFELWCGWQPQAVQVVRDGSAAPAGLQVLLALEATGPEQRAADPATAAAWEYLRGHAPVRAGDRITLVRFWLDAAEYQRVSPVQTVLALQLVRYYLTTPGLAYHFFSAANPDDWAGVCAYADLRRLPDADFTVGGRRYGVYGHDWRVTPPLAWLDLLAARETGEGAEPSSGTATGGPPVGGLDHDHFMDAVRAALRDLDRPDRLATSPLVKTRAAAGLAGGGPGMAVRRLLQEGAATLAESVRDRSAYRALHHTYLRPAGSQQAAAELLDLPMSTYRRHLATGVRRLAEILWRRELDASGPSGH